MWKIISKHSAILRAITVVAVVGALVSSVTYAALQSPTAALTGNTIQSATANLLVGTASASSTAFSASHSGFSFSGVIPGGPAVPANGNVFYLKNTGSVVLNLKLNVTGTPANTGSVDLSKVTVQLTRVDTGAAQSASLQTLMDSSAAGGLVLTDSLAPASTGTQYTMSVSMAADAYAGTGGAVVGPFDFVFSGVAAL